MSSYQRCIMIFLCFFMQAAYAAKTTASPVGYWQTIDDVTHQPKAIVQIWETDQILYGRILKIYPREGAPEIPLCTACKGPKHNKRIVGMTILSGLKRSQTAGEWTGGEILDPKNGKTYHCYIALADQGQKLKVKGYIGVPLFGRSQHWVRASNPRGD